MRQPSGALLQSLGLITLLVLVFGTATLAFWWYVSENGLLILNDAELYFLRGAGLLGLLVGGLGLLLTLGAFRRAAMPTADLLQAAEQAAQGDYNIELQERGPLELRSLTRAFNRVIERFRNQTLARRHLERGLARALQDSYKTDDLSHSLLLADWVRLTEAESGERPINPEPTDLTTLVRETLTGLYREASERSVALRALMPDPNIIAELDPICLAEILRGMTLYSLSRIPHGGEIRVDVSETHDPEGIVLEVADNGVALPPEVLDNLFFLSKIGSSPGSGLELPLARALARSQGGDVHAANRSPNGLTLTLFLPFD
ncbi:MAG: ATP-binding protein [Rudaea sp.]